MDLIGLEEVWKGFNERVLLRGVTLSIGEGERVGLLGPNGSGKSTLLRVLAGVEPFDRGKRVLRRDLRLGYLEQNPALEPHLTVRESVRASLTERERVLAELQRVHGELESADSVRVPQLLARQSRLEAELESHGGHDVEHKVESTLHALGLEHFDAPCGQLSGGERRRVALARLLLARPELILLDEPTNHLDAFVTEWLEDWFLQTRTPLLLVTHDRYFLDRVVDRIVELDRGQLWASEGGYGEYLEARTARLESESRSESTRLNLLRRETAWMRRGPPARTTKAKARIRRYQDLVGDAPTLSSNDLELVIPPGPRLGARVLSLRGVSKRYGERSVVPRLELELEPGMRLGIVGPNGAGKSTLIRMLLGEVEPDTGVREVGETVRFMGIDQQRSGLDLSHTVLEEVAGHSDVIRVGDRSVRAASFLDRFGFPAAAQSCLISQLSGGERSRVALAKLLCAGGNVIVLDEPTNDLDLTTLRALEEALLAFEGALVVVSHDRWFLDRVATHILHLDGAGHARLHHGSFSDLLEALAREKAAARPAAETSKAIAKLAATSAPSKPKRLTPWQEQELAQVEQRIGALEGELAGLDARLAAGDLYLGPRAALDEVTAQRARVSDQLGVEFARWEELESMRSKAP